MLPAYSGRAYQAGYQRLAALLSLLTRRHNLIHRLYTVLRRLFNPPLAAPLSDIVQIVGSTVYCVGGQEKAAGCGDYSIM